MDTETIIKALLFECTGILLLFGNIRGLKIAQHVIKEDKEEKKLS